VLSLTDLTSDISIEVAGEGDREGNWAADIIGVGVVREGRVLLGFQVRLEY